MKLIMVRDDGTPIELDHSVEGSGTTAQMLEIFTDCIVLQNRKAKTYGEAYRSQGYMGNLARVLSKVARIKNMLWKDFGDQFEDGDESTKDTMLDLINITCFFLINRRDHNKWGNEL